MQGGGIAEGNFLVDAFLAHTVLPLKRIVGEGERIAGVTRVLVVHGVYAQAELAVPVM